MAACLLNLQRKLGRKIDQRKTIQLSPEEIDIMVERGAYDAIVKAAIDFRKEQLRQRCGVSTPPAIADGVSGSSGVTTNRMTSEALARVRALLQGPER